MAKVEFEIANVEKEIKDIYYNFDNGVSSEIGKIYNLYSKLSRKLQKSNDINERNKIIGKFFRSTAKENKGKSIKYKDVFQKIWNIVNDNFMDIISDIMDIKINENEIFHAEITFSSEKKRDFKNNKFKIFSGTKTRELKDSIFLEMFYLIFEMKFKALIKDNLNLKLKHHFAEIFSLLILTDSKIQKISKYKPIINEEYEKIIIGSDFLLNMLKKTYKKQDNFDLFFKNLWELMKDNRDKFAHIIY